MWLLLCVSNSAVVSNSPQNVTCAVGRELCPFSLAGEKGSVNSNYTGDKSRKRSAFPYC